MKQSLKDKLNKLYDGYDFKGRVAHDPIELPHQYSRREDIEVSGFIASCFAYGRVDLFKPVIRSLLKRMGQSPYDFLVSFDVRKQSEIFAGLSYRFNKNKDIVTLIHILSTVLKKYGSIESVFKQNYRESDTSIKGGLTGLVDSLLSIDASPAQFFPSPGRGSACKRMNMFLRWMIRDRDIDFGIWSGIPKNKLVIPLDVHIARISKCLGFTGRSTQDWKMAVEITDSLKKLDADDPLKYDFALCHQGIARICSSMRCSECSLTADF